MDIKKQLDGLYLSMIFYELRLFNHAKGESISYNSLLYTDIIGYRQNCTASYIADSLNVARSAVTLKVHELQRLGLVRKSRSTEDKRVFHLEATPEAARLNKKRDMPINNAIDEIRRDYTSKQIDDFCRILEVFERHYDTNGESDEKSTGD